MGFDNDTFIDLLNYCKNLDNFHKSAKKPFDTIYNISKSEGKHKHPLVPDSRYWCFNLDNICENVHIMPNGRIKIQPASTDGLHYNKSLKKLYFIELKGLSINSIDYKEKLKSITKELKKRQCEIPEETCPISEELLNSMDDIKNRYEDEIICQLKIKTTESLFFTFPEIYRKYCETNGISYKETLNDFISWLLNSEKMFIVVFNDKKELSITNKHFSFENRLKSKFKHFNNVANINAVIVEKSLFEEKFLQEYFIRIDLPPYTSVDYINFLNKN